MILKNADDKSSEIAQLEGLAATTSGDLRKRIDRQLKNVIAGARAEKEAAYHIDFYLKDSGRVVVLHDLRFVVDGQVTQIDHLILHTSMTFFVLETKSFHAGVKITDNGEFLRWNGFTSTYEGMPSPIEQNARHIHVLDKIFDKLTMPKRLGIWLMPTLKSAVVVNPKARIIRSKRYPTDFVVKADQLITHIEKVMSEIGALKLAAKYVSQDVLIDIGKQLLKGHRPVLVNYADRFGLDTAMPETLPNPEFPIQELVDVAIVSAPVTPSEEVPVTEAPAVSGFQICCKACKDADGDILSGRFGYYFKCDPCGSNTPISLTCANNHKMKVRKAGESFFAECPICVTSDLLVLAATR